MALKQMFQRLLVKEPAEAEEYTLKEMVPDKDVPKPMGDLPPHERKANGDTREP